MYVWMNVWISYKEWLISFPRVIFPHGEYIGILHVKYVHCIYVCIICMHYICITHTSHISNTHINNSVAARERKNSVKFKFILKYIVDVSKETWKLQDETFFFHVRFIEQIICMWFIIIRWRETVRSTHNVMHI